MMTRRLVLPQQMAIALLVSAGTLVSLPALSSTESQASQSSASVTSADNPLLAQTSSVGSIVDVAANDDDFDTLVQAVEAAGLDDTLAEGGPFTVFAPTDAAFDNLPDGTLDALLRPENRDLLTDILTYHVVPDEVPSDELETGGLDTLNGGLAVQVNPDRVVVNDASVVRPDIDANNGVIHGINRVLIPPATRAALESRLGRPAAAPVRALW